MVAAHHLASDCKYASVHRMLMATQPFMLPARMVTIRYVLGEGGKEGGGRCGERMVCVVLEEEGEDEQSKMQALKCWGEE